MRARLADIVFTVLLAAAALCVAFLSTRFGWQHDFSYAQRSSLDARTVELLHRLDAPVDIVSYAGQEAELRGAIADFLARYQRIKSDISLRFVDPDADPAATRAAGISIDGELDIRYQDRSEQLKVLTEREFDNALVRLARTRVRLVAFLAGDGERRPDGKANADLGNFGALLTGQGVRTLSLTLTAGMHIPQNVDVLVLASPQVPLAAPVVAEIDDYLARGGNFLWLVDPGSTAGLDTLAKALSLRVLDGTVVDGAGAAFGIGDPSFVAISTYPHNPVTQDFSLTTLFPQAAALGVVAGSEWKVQPLLRTGPKSWTRIGPIPQQGDTATIAYDADKGEIPGPLDIGVALSRLSPSPDKSEQRVIVIGDGDFLSNAFLGNGGNREFGQRVFDWLLQDDALIQIPDKGAPDRQLHLSQTELGVIGLGFLAGLPLALAFAGAVIWWRRRRS
ncbi:MAG: GldG family protein [Xanthomonadaceae bacterium]|nr:GldG family protein [Xanthomonadaceae bacterium]